MARAEVNGSLSPSWRNISEYTLAVELQWSMQVAGGLYHLYVFGSNDCLLLPWNIPRCQLEVHLEEEKRSRGCLVPHSSDMGSSKVRLLRVLSAKIVRIWFTTSKISLLSLCDASNDWSLGSFGLTVSWRPLAIFFSAVQADRPVLEQSSVTYSDTKFTC